jgi:HlyD family secretion protein
VLEKDQGFIADRSFAGARMRFKFPKKRKVRLGMIALISVFVLILVWAFRPRSILVDLAVISQGGLQERVIIDGRFRSEKKWTVTAFADGDIQRMPLEVGDPLKKGQVITQIYWDTRYEPLRAPMSGVVSKVFRESAGPIRRGEAILEVVDPEVLEVVAEVLTPEAQTISEGDPAWIRDWGGPGTLQARVKKVSRSGFTKLSALGVEEERTEVTLELAEAHQPIGNDFHVEVEIQTHEVADAVLVPVGALFRDGELWSVYVFERGRAALRHLELGHQSEESAEVLGGLTEGESVVLYPGELVRPGVRLKRSKKPA